MASGGASARKARDVDLLDALESLTPEPFDGDVWRIIRNGRDPLQGYPAGARWDPLGVFDVLYTALDPDGAHAEVFFHLNRAPVFPSRTAYLLHTIRVQTRKTLRLADMTALAALKVDTGRYSELDYTQTQAIGDATHFLGFDGLIVPSARSESRNLILFMDRLDPNDPLVVTRSEAVDWQAWRTRDHVAARR
ncbi:MAG: RES family NAD+ phosphorylase [Proteobacteria bacterium]|nr:RES family NAD+ phosphorylase [Pseudomonadota bacterium]